MQIGQSELGPHDDLYERIDFNAGYSPVSGTVRWSPVKSLWWVGLLLFWLVFGLVDFSWGAVVVFLGTTAVTLCLGHSIGMHRMMIHQAFAAPKWLERTLIYLGTLVGMGGPMTMMWTHDVRDWAQRQSRAHDFLTHGRSILQDFWWQLHCKLDLDREPRIQYPQWLVNDRFYRFLNDTMMWQQVPLAIVLFAIGGIGWVAWGIAGRVTVSLFGHWLVGYFAHNQGTRDWDVKGASVQGYNVERLGILTFGECWHNNHHAFPRSAKLGLQAGQRDPGWVVISWMQRLGLVWNVQTPDTLMPRAHVQLAKTSKDEG